MKNVLKLIEMTVIGLFVVLILYPAIHEAGHVVITHMFGGKCLEYNLFPFPYVICNVAGITDMQMVIISLSGLVIPFFFSSILKGKFFAIWYAGLLYRCVIIISMLVSSGIVIVRKLGHVIPNDDITKALDIWKDGSLWILGGAFLISLILIIQVIMQHPIKRIAVRFELA